MEEATITREQFKEITKKQLDDITKFSQSHSDNPMLIITLGGLVMSILNEVENAIFQ